MADYRIVIAATKLHARHARAGRLPWQGRRTDRVCLSVKEHCRSRRELAAVKDLKQRQNRGDMEHIVLLGDSIFDNAPYVPAGTDVTAQLRATLGPRHAVSLLARDGDVLADMPAQLARLGRLDAPASWLLVSCGGNDVLGLVGEMQRPVRTVLEGMALLAGWQAAFARDYRHMLDLVLAQGKPTALATIYDSVPGLAPGLRTALAAFNDIILREAVARRLPVLDLRLVCTDAGDYASASPIEPSAQGAARIAAAIGVLVRAHDRAAGHTVVYGAAGRGGEE